MNLGTFLAANCIAASSYCRTFSKATVWLNLVMWTCWNTVRMLPSMSRQLLLPAQSNC